MANAVFSEYYLDSINDLERKINSGMRLAELYKPYVFFMGRYL
jgi:hypothetical protein